MHKQRFIADPRRHETVYGNSLMVTVDTNKCNGCEECLNVCPQGVFIMNGNLSDPYLEFECVFCQACLGVCPGGAIAIPPA